MSKPNVNLILMGLEKLLASGHATKLQLKGANDALLDYLRNQKNETPDWDLYPLSRTWFSQRP